MIQPYTYAFFGTGALAEKSDGAFAGFTDGGEGFRKEISQSLSIFEPFAELDGF